MKGIVDWKEEHLLRKRAIERTLKRRIIFQKQNKEMAESLIYELIRSGHFPNDSIPEHKIQEIQKIIINISLYLKIALKNCKKKNLNFKIGL